MGVYETLRSAVQEKLQVAFFYDGHMRLCCPHAVGLRDGRQRLMAYQFGGSSSKGLPLGGQWRCFEVARIHDVQAQEGPWYTGTSHTRPNSCIHVVDVETYG